MTEEEANSVINTEGNANANSQTVDKGTQENGNSTNATIENVAHTVDYQKKFSESSKEALRLVEVQKEKDAEIERLRKELELKGNGDGSHQNADSLFPGFENLDEEARNNLIAYTDIVTKRVEDRFSQNPAIAFATKQYNETVFDNALQRTIEKYPQLAETKDEFKSKYFNVNNVPQNIEDILGDVAKIHLFDKAKDIGAKETEEKQNRVDGERNTAGPKETTVNRTLEDWQRMAQENPAKFAKLNKEYKTDLESGKI